MGAQAGKRGRACRVWAGGLKVHSKVALVVRQEGNEIRRYVHLATGNYNAATARLYTDIGLFTARPTDRRRRHRPVQLSDRVLTQAGLPEAAGRARDVARRVRGPDPSARSSISSRDGPVI